MASFANALFADQLAAVDASDLSDMLQRLEGLSEDEISALLGSEGES